MFKGKNGVWAKGSAFLVAAALVASITTSASGSTSAKTDSVAAAAQKILNPFYNRPTQIPISVPFSKPIPKGKLIDYVSCGGTPCIIQAAIVKKAAAILGWRYKYYGTTGTPQSYQAAFEDVLRDKPAGVIYQSIDASSFRPQLKALKKAGVFVAGVNVTDPVSLTNPDLPDYNIDTLAQFNSVGVAMAAYVLAKSGSKSDLLYLNVPDFASLAPLGVQIKKTFNQICPKCTFNEINVPFSDITAGTSPNLVVSYLRSHPSVNWVGLAYDQVGQGLPAALKAAGITGVRIMGDAPDPVSLGYIKAGQQAATVLHPAWECLFAAVDAVARTVVGLPIPPVSYHLTWVIDKSNFPSQPYPQPVVANVIQDYEKLWGK
jgi:ribose transport system substrate-binding protein